MKKLLLIIIGLTISGAIYSQKFSDKRQKVKYSLKDNGEILMTIDMDTVIYGNISISNDSIYFRSIESQNEAYNDLPKFITPNHKKNQLIFTNNDKTGTTRNSYCFFGYKDYSVELTSRKKNIYKYSFKVSNHWDFSSSGSGPKDLSLKSMVISFTPFRINKLEIIKVQQKKCKRYKLEPINQE